MKKDNNNWKKLIITLAVLLVLSSFGIATTTIRDGAVSEFFGINTGEINATSINGVYYVTPNDGADIQTKINLANANGGGKIIISEGIYNVNTQITTSGSDFPLIISGSGSGTIINLTGTEGFFRATGNDNNFLIENLFISANDVTQTIISLSQGEHNNSVFQNLIIKDANGIGINHNGSSFTVNNVFFNNVLDGIVSNTDSNSYPRKAFISDNTFINNYASDVNEGIELNWHGSNNTYAFISNNYVSGYREDGMDINSYYSNIINNVVIDPVYNGIETSSILVNHNSLSSKSVISNNIILNIVGNGIYSNSDGFVSISNNYLEGSNSMGRGYGIRLTQTQKASVYGNNFNSLNVGISNELTGAPTIPYLLNNFVDTSTTVSNNLISLVSNRVEFNSRIDVSSGDLRIGNTSTKGSLSIYGASSQPLFTIAGSDSSIVYMTLSSSSTREIDFENTGSANLNLKIKDGNLTISQQSGTGNAYACFDSNGKLYRSASACS